MDYLYEVVNERHKEDAERVFKELIKDHPIGTLEELERIFSDSERMMALSNELHD